IMLVGENSREISTRVRERLEDVQKSLPDGVKVKTLYDRTYLVDATIHTVAKSLAEGAVLVIVVLFLLLGNLRAALIAALAIPFSMLITISGMVEGKVSGNLMSLGAIDFGLIVDGSVIVVENSIRRFAREQEQLGRVLRLEERLSIAYAASREVLQASVFGSIIIAVVYLPILSLTGIEGKMFRPMALTVVIALTGATVLSMTFIPALVSVALGGRIQEKENVVFRVARGAYERTLRAALAQRPLVVTLALGLVGVASAFALGLGSEFAPKLGEGALAVQSSRIPSISISASVEMQMTLERVLKEKFPDEIDRVFARTGTAEVATDPMGPNVSDTYIMLTPREQWTKASTQAELAEEMEKALRDLPGQSFELSQPIELRFNELISGVRSDVAVKVFGDDLETMKAKAAQISDVLSRVEGAADVKVEQTSGLPVLTMQIDRAAVGRYGLAVEDVQDIVSAAVGGAEAGQVYDGDRRFDLVVRMPESLRRDVRALENLPIPLPEHGAEEGADERFVPLGALAHVSIEEGPNQVSREDGKRRVVVQCNVRGRDLGGFVAEAQRKIDAEVERTPGVWLPWGGQFENLIEARERLAVVVPVALFLILALLYAAFGSAKNALLIFSGVPLALTGGVAALFIRGLPFSISAAVGFIALSGVAVLNGLVMVSFIESLRQSGVPLDRALFEGSIARLRPVLMTALVAALGFIPMALATGTGAEVQRPLATVVVGGIISSTLLTLVVLPVLYRIFNRGGTAVVDAQRPPEEATVSASGAE
ncbi:MAG: CusA/CzcA family heavy metal efflux RND transporter, partial [Myxococcales bacterium]|nr:CusA/CzcA family heavy metal efflux RND transporter [Myxococcales bacterium]